MSHNVGADSEFGRLRTVLMHRPGAELRRITPKTRCLLGFAAQPWVTRAQQEHDKLADALRGRGTEVIYLTGLLQDVFEYSSARHEAIGSAAANPELGEELATALTSHLGDLSPEDLAATLIAGLTSAELRGGHGLVHDLLGPHDFVIEPLPNLVFGRDASAYVGDQAVIGALRGRRRETDLFALIYRHHPRFAGSGELGGESLSEPFRAHGTSLDAGDLLLLGPGTLAVGVGARTTAASAEQLARHLLSAGTVHTVLAVPTGPLTGPSARALGSADVSTEAGGSRLSTQCTVLDSGVVLMAPALAFTLTALTITASDGVLRVSRPRPFLEAAARALGIDQLTVIETGVVSPARSAGQYGQRGQYSQWDDGGNTLAIGTGTLICDERNEETNARLVAAGFEVVPVPFGELGDFRGGPRSMCVPMSRDPASPASSASDRDLTPTYRTRLTTAVPVETAEPGAELASAARPAADPEEADAEQHHEHDPERDDERVDQSPEQQPQHDQQRDSADNEGKDAQHASTVRGTRGS